MNQVLQMKLISEKQWHELQWKIKQTTQSRPAFFHSIYEVAYEDAKLISFIKSSRYISLHIFFCSSDPTTNSETRNEKKSRILIQMRLFYYN